MSAQEVGTFDLPCAAINGNADAFRDEVKEVCDALSTAHYVCEGNVMNFECTLQPNCTLQLVAALRQDIGETTIAEIGACGLDRLIIN